MKCTTCGAWSEVKETRKADDGYTLRRTRLCANGHRFPTFEVLEPVYNKSPDTVRQTRVAAQVRAVQWRRDTEIAKMAAEFTHQRIADLIGSTRQAVTKAVARVRRRKNTTTR